MVWVVNGTDAPFNVIPVIGFGPALDGTSACRSMAPAATAMLKDRTLPLHAIDWQLDPLRPSSQSSICRAVITGTLRAFAEFTIASDHASLVPPFTSVCMLAVNAP